MASDFDKAATRARIREACQWFSADINRDEYVEAIAGVVEGPPFGAHTGWWMANKHPSDRAAEIEEEWRYPKVTNG